MRRQRTPPPQAVPLPFQGSWHAKRDGGVVLLSGRKNFYQKKKLLVKARKTWYDNSNEANNKAGHGRLQLPHAPMQENRPPTQ